MAVGRNIFMRDFLMTPRTLLDFVLQIDIFRPLRTHRRVAGLSGDAISAYKSCIIPRSMPPSTFPRVTPLLIAAISKSVLVPLSYVPRPPSLFFAPSE